MPLPTRQVDPTFVARSVYEGPSGQLQQATDLETVTNTTLTNIIRQLSSLSKHSEDLFGELARDAGQLSDRANSLQARIDRLAIKVTQLDSTVEDVSLTDIQLKKPFRSAIVFDQEIFSRATMPAPMLETYQQCDKPPPLDKLNCYRDDGKDGLKFYTDPNYFFELWRQEMLEDTERMKHDRGKKMHKGGVREGGPGQGGGHGGQGGQGGGGQGGGGQGARNKKKVRQPHNTREKQRQIAIGHGETLMPNNVIYRTPNSVINDPEQQHYNHIGIYDSRPNRPNSIELRRSYPAEQIDGGMPQYAPTSPGGHAHQQQQQMMMMNANHYQQAQYHQVQQQQMYDESIYNSAAHQSAIYGSNNGQGPLSSESLYAASPSRKGPRPSQPPPAPPSGGSGGTPTASNANTPTRGRSMSTGRDTLPPPPPVPEGMMGMMQATGSPPHLQHMQQQQQMQHMQQQMMGQQQQMNGGQNVAMMKMIAGGRGQSVSRSGSPQLMAHQQHGGDPNAALVMQQLNQMNNLHAMAHQMHQNQHDLPPPPPIPADQQLSSPPNVAPPPPPPPPPLLDSPPKRMGMGNGDAGGMMGNGGIGGLAAQMSKVTLQKKVVQQQPVTDVRSDLMKSIRDGIKLRKVEKTDKLENEKSNPTLHDVASILARRVAIELSESESSGSDDDSEEWVEPNETSA